MSDQRPGKDIGPPVREHQVVVMLMLLSMCEDAEELQAFEIGLRRAAMAWGWSPDRLAVELDAAQQVLIEYKSRLTMWLEPDGTMQFDYNCEEPA